MGKKYIAILLAFAMLLGMTACGAGNQAAEEPTAASTTAQSTVEAASEPAEPAIYTFTFDGMMGKETAQFELSPDGSCKFSLPGNPMLTDVYAGTFTREGDTVTVEGLTNVDTTSSFTTPGLWDWIVDGGTVITVDDAAGAFVPVGGSGGSAAGAPGGENDLPEGTTDVAYATTSPAQVCDIYTPEGVEQAPVIVLVHGGGFAFGDQAMTIIQPVIKAAVANGYAVVSVDYRKSGEAAFPAALADVKAAVRFVKANAVEYGFDAEHIAIWGESAGAYLSVMTALTPEAAELNGDVADNGGVSSAVTALVSFYAPVEFWTMDDEYAALGNPDSTFATDSSFESKFLGQAIGADKDKTYTTYWETYADQLPSDLKAWIQVGNADKSVPYTQSQNLAERLSGYLGAENVQFGILDGAGHEDAAFYTDENLSAIFAWLDGFMKG